MEERTNNMYEAMLSAGTNFVTEQIIADNLLQMSDEDKANARALAARSGLEEELTRRALAGDQVALNETLKALTD